MNQSSQTSDNRPIIVWLNNCLRLNDNPALYKAGQKGAPLILVYVHADSGPFAPPGAAAKVWLHHSLSSLDQALDAALVVLKGQPGDMLAQLCAQTDAQALYFNHSFTADRLEVEKSIATHLRAKGTKVVPINGSFMAKPETVLKDDGRYYKVFTPFYKRFLAVCSPRKPYPKPTNLKHLLSAPTGKLATINSLNLLPTKAWGQSIIQGWQISEQGAINRLHHFIDTAIAAYKDGRNYPHQDTSSRLSPYLSFGQISPNTIWHTIQHNEISGDSEAFLRQLVWREFYGHLHYHAPQFLTQNVQTQFDDFGFEQTSDHLEAWQKGTLGIPIIDAGMRELWATGTMHNRVRMLVASVLTKNMNLDWRIGAAWFEDCLFDANLANNRGGWQWVAGTGTDAAPYFRIFNPVTQAQKFDAEGHYVRQWVPELNNLDTQHIHTPHLAPAHALKEAGITFNKTYPRPVLDLSATRQQALDRLSALKQKRAAGS